MLVCDNGKEVVQGSGFFIKQGIVVTNYHVIKGMIRGIAQVAIGAKKEKRNFRIARIIAFDEDSDLALLSIPSAKEANILSLELVPFDKQLEVGETIYALGNPEGLVGTISPGIISANLRSSEKKARIQITAPISSGSSGGPIVNAQGLVLGVAVGSLVDGQNLNFAVPTSLIFSLVKDAKFPDKLDDYIDTQNDKDAKVPANWIWATNLADVPKSQSQKPVLPKSIIGGVRQGETFEEASLRKLEGIYVSIEEFNSLGQKYLSSLRLKTDIELRLRRNGIKVVDRENYLNSPETAKLYLNITMLKGTNSGLISYFWELELNQPVRLDRDRTFYMIRSTWETGGIGLCSPDYFSSEVNSAVAAATDEFCKVYLKANSP